MNTTIQHTPTPWHTADRPRANVIKGRDEVIIARTEPVPEKWSNDKEALAEASANAAFIVTACNAYQANQNHIADLERLGSVVLRDRDARIAELEAALLHLEQAYANKHSPLHRANALMTARAALKGAE